MIFSIRANELDFIWPQIARFIESALAINGCTMTVEEAKDRIRNSLLQLYVIDDNGIKGALTTECDFGPKNRILRVVTLGADGYDKYHNDVTDFVVAAARSMNAIAQFIGRPGWERKYTQRTGWRKVLVVFEKE